MKYLTCIFWVSWTFLAYGQLPNCKQYGDFKVEAQALLHTDPKKALLKYESMLECDPESARKDSVAEKIVAIFKNLHEAQQKAERLAREADKKKREAVVSEEKLNAALQKTYLTRAQKEFGAERYDSALYYSSLIKRVPGQSFGHLEPESIKQYISKKKFDGELISEEGPFKDHIYSKKKHTLTNTKNESEIWKNIPEAPRVLKSDFDSTAVYLIFNQRLEDKQDQCETVILEARPGSAPQLAGQFKTPLSKEINWDYYKHYDVDFISHRTVLLKIIGAYSHDATFSLLSLTNRKFLYFENADYDLNGDTLEVRYKMNGERLFEKYQLPALELVYQENRDKKLPNAEKSKPVEPEKLPETIFQTPLWNFRQMEVFKTKKISEKKKPAYALYFKKDTNANPRLLLESKYSFDDSKVYLDTVRQQLIVIQPNVHFVSYDIRSDSILKKMEFDAVLYAPESVEETGFLKWYQLTDSLLSRCNGQDGFVFLNSNGYKLQSWGRGGTAPEAILNLVSYEALKDNEEFCMLEYKKNESGFFKAELVKRGGKKIKTWSQATKISPEGEDYLPNWGFVQYADPKDGSTGVDVIYCSDYQSDIKIISLKNTAIDSLRFEYNYLFQKAKTAAGIPVRKIYTPFKYGLEKDAFMLNTIYFPDSLILRGEIPEPENYSNFDIRGSVLFHQKHCETCTETDNFNFSDYDFYALPDLQPVGHVSKAGRIDLFEHAQMLRISRPDGTQELLDLKTGKFARQADWKKIYGLKFLDSLQTLLMVEYSNSIKDRVDILTYPKLKKANSFEYGKGQRFGHSWGYYWVNSSGIIRGKYMYIFTDYMDSTGKQQLQLFSIKNGKLELLKKWEVGINFYIAHENCCSFSRCNTEIIINHLTNEETIKEHCNTPGYSLYISKDFALYSAKTHSDSALNTTLFTLDPFKVVKTWKNVCYIDSVGAHVLRIHFLGSGKVWGISPEFGVFTTIRESHFREPECTELFDWKNKKILEPCHNDGRPDYFAGKDPKDPDIVDITFETLWEDEKYRLLCQRTRYHYYNTQSDYKLESKRNKKETVWSGGYRYRFDRKNERLSLFYVGYYLDYDNRTDDELIVYDCKNGFKKLHHLSGKILGSTESEYYGGKKQWWHRLNIEIKEKSNTGLVCFAERDTIDKSMFSIHFIDTVSAKNFYHVIKSNDRQHLTVIGDFMLIHTDISNKKNRLEIYDLRTFNLIPNAAWSVQEGHAHTWETVGPNHLGIWEAFHDGPFLIYSLDSLKTRFRYQQAGRIWTEQIQVGSISKTIKMLPNNQTEISVRNLTTGGRQIHKRFNLDVFEGSDFNKLLYRFEQIKDFNFANRLLFIAKDTALFTIKKPDWEVYDLSNNLQKLGIWENSTFESEPPCLLSNEKVEPYLDLDKPEKDRRKMHDLTFFNPKNPDIRLTVSEAGSYNVFKNLIAVENNQIYPYADLRLYHAKSFEAIGEWKKVRGFSEYSSFKMSDSIVVVEHNCRPGICDVDLLQPPTFQKTGHYDHVSDFVELEESGNYGLIRHFPNDTTRTIGEIRRVSDGKLLSTFSRDYHFKFYDSRNYKIINLNRTENEVSEKLAFLDGKLYLLPPGHSLVDDSVFVKCEGKLYSIAATKETISEEEKKFDWVIEVYDHSQSGPDLPPVKVKDLAFRIVVAGEETDNKPVFRYDEKNTCELTITIGSNNRIENLKK